MIVKITSKRQVTFPAQVLDALGVGPGDQLELEERAGGPALRPASLLRDRVAWRIQGQVTYCTAVYGARFLSRTESSRATRAHPSPLTRLLRS